MLHEDFACARRMACAALLAGAAAVGTVSADQPNTSFSLYDGSATKPREGQFYGSLTFNAGVQHLPRFNGAASFFSGAVLNAFAVNEFAPKPTTVEPGGELGFVLRDGTVPEFLGRRVRLAVFGSYTHAEQRLSQATLAQPSNGVVIYNGVNGAFLSALALGPGFPLSETLKIERDAFQIGFKVESEFALTPSLTLTPSLAVFGGRSSDSFVHTSTVNLVGLGFDFLPTGINERLRTREIGGHAGARATWQFLPGFALHVGGTAGPVWLHSRMSASDCFNNALVPAGTPCSAGTVGFVTTSASDSRSALAFRGTLTLGLAADLRFAVISIGGFGRYDSRIPGIQNPQQSGIFTGPTVAPARIRFQDGFAYGGFVSIRVAIGY